MRFNRLLNSNDDVDLIASTHYGGRGRDNNISQKQFFISLLLVKRCRSFVANLAQLVFLWV